MDNIENVNEIQHEVQVEKLGVFKRIIGVILFPEKVMKDLVERPRILLSFFILTLVAFVPFILFFDMMKALVITQFESSGSDFAELNIDAMATGSLVGGMIVAPMVLIISWLVGALILTLFIKIFKGTGSIKTYFSITGYANVILVLSTVVTIVIALVTGQYSRDAVSVTSLASFLDPEKVSVFLYTLASGIELFTIWMYAIIGIGVSCASGFSKQKSLAIVFTIYIVGLLLTSLIVTASLQLANLMTY